MDKRLFNILGIFFLLAVTLVGVNVFVSGKAQTPGTSEAASIPPGVSKFIPEVSPKPKPSVPVVSTVQSPDGKLEAKLSQLTSNPKNKWTFTVSDKNILQEDLPITTTLSVPDNAFSPDDKYIFLRQDMSGVNSFIVFKTNGESFTGGLSSIEMASLFDQKEPEFKITDVTGWAAPNLIIINTDKKEGGIGPSFWFDVNTKAFIRLSSRFN